MKLLLYTNDILDIFEFKKVLLRYISSYNKGGYFFEIRSPDLTSIFDQ